MISANPFTCVDGSTAFYPHRLDLRTDPAVGLYVPGAAVSLELSDPLLRALDAAVNARFTPEQRLASIFGRLVTVRQSADAVQRVRIASSAAHVLGIGLSALDDSLSGPSPIRNFRSNVAC